MDITRDNYDEFKKLYKKAVKENKQSFMFGDQEVLTKYAMYVIKYLEGTI